MPGAELYKSICIGCHQPDGKGKEKLAREPGGLALREGARCRRGDADPARRQGRRDRPDAAARRRAERRADCVGAHLHPPRVGAHGVGGGARRRAEIRGLTKTRTQAVDRRRAAAGPRWPRRAGWPRGTVRIDQTDATGKPRKILDAFRLDGRVALVTGGARGLGLTMATALAEAGADIAISGPHAAGLRGGGRTDHQGHGPSGRCIQRRRDEGGRRREARSRRRGQPRQDRHPDQQRRHQHPRSDSGPVRGGLGCGHRHEPQGTVALREGDRAAHGGARLGPRDQHRVDPFRHRHAGPDALCVLEGRHHSA